MFPFKQTFPTPKERTAGKNTCQYVIVHHTGTKEWTIKGVLDGLYRRDDYASCHFVVDTNWDAYKIGSPADILWHAWESEWWKLKNMNQYSVGIEVIGPLSDGWFTKAQKETVKKLIEHLMAVFKIPKENVLKHADITWARSKDMKLWDWKSKSRKVDIARTFVDNYENSWWNFQKALVPKEM